jgi:hypothetical protein
MPGRVLSPDLISSNLVRIVMPTASTTSLSNINLHGRLDAEGCLPLLRAQVVLGLAESAVANVPAQTSPNKIRHKVQHSVSLRFLCCKDLRVEER